MKGVLVKGFEKIESTLELNGDIKTKDLAKIIFENRGKIIEIVNGSEDFKKYRNGNHTNWYLLFADFREHLGLPRFMELNTFNALIEIIVTTGESLNYEEFFRIFKKSQAKSLIDNDKYSGTDVSKKIQNQGERLAQGLVEITANAIDATTPEKTIGRFGEGFYQSLKFLKSGDGELVVESKKEGERGYSIHLINENGKNMIGSVGNNKENNGTIVRLNKKLSEEEINSLKEYFIKAFKTNKKLKVLLNGNLVNDLDEYYYSSLGKVSNFDLEVNVKINEDGFEVVDTGIGMSAQDIGEKLLYPDVSGKKRVNDDSMSKEDLVRFTLEETSFFYKNGAKFEKKDGEIKKQHTKIRLQVGGVLIEDFDAKTSYDVSEFCMEFPSFTWLPKSRNKIELTKGVVVALEISLNKIKNDITNKKDKVMVLEIIGIIIRHLKSRESSRAGSKGEYDISKISKNTFREIKKELEKDGKTIISNIPGIQEIIPQSDDIIFVDQIFMDFDVRKIPGIKKLKNIQDRKYNFYELYFGEQAPYDYLILNGIVIVNSKYTKNSQDLAKINTQVNLNTGYEKGDDKVFYGVIIDNQTEQKDDFNISIEDNNITKEKAEKLKISIKKYIGEFGNDKYPIENILMDLENGVYNYSLIVEVEFLLSLSYNESVFFWNSYFIYNFYSEFPTDIANKIKSIMQNLSENFYNNYYTFSLNANTISNELFLKFIEKIKESENLESYALTIIDLLNNEDNSNYVLSNLRSLVNSSDRRILDKLGIFEGDTDENREFNESGLSKSSYNQLSSLREKYNISNLTINRILPSGEIIGLTTINNLTYPFRGNEVIKNINGYEIEKIGFFDIHPDGDIMIVAELKGAEKISLFKGNKRIISVKSDKVNIFSNLKIGQNGEIYGLIDNNLFVGSEFFKNSNGIDKIEYVTQEDGIFRGIYTSNGIRYTFKGDATLKNVGGVKMEPEEFMGYMTDGKVVGRVSIEGSYKYLPLVGNNVIIKIGGKLIQNCSIIKVGDNDEVYGIVEIDGKNCIFKGDEIIKSFDDDYVFCELKLFSDGSFYYDVEDEFSIDKRFFGNLNLDKFFQYGPEIKKENKLFLELLAKGGKILKRDNDEISFNSGNSITLTDIIGASRHFEDDLEGLKTKNAKQVLSSLKERIDYKLKNRSPFYSFITSTIDGQDRSNMIWIREGVQNSHDAILKMKRNLNKSRKFSDKIRELLSAIPGKIKIILGNKEENLKDELSKFQAENIDKINIDFYTNGTNWVSRITDHVGMSTYEVFKYLLTPGKSGKEQDIGATGMFGQGFYSLAIGAKEIRLKTSTGDGKTTYIKLLPIYNENNHIIDFQIIYDIKDEVFIGTIIERVDESVGIGGNIGALVGIQNMGKYVGNVGDIEINYNGEKAFESNNVIIIDTQEIEGLGTLKLKQNKDQEERLSKDDLYISEIKDEYINFLPDYMVDYVKEGKYSLDLPHNIKLTDTRNSITDFEENIRLLTPHIFNLITRQYLRDFLKGKVKIPMLPLDYFGLDYYEGIFNSEIVTFAEIVNQGGILKKSDIEKLKDKELMVQFLICLEVFNKGEKISLRELKRRRNDEAKALKHTNNRYLADNDSKYLNDNREIIIDNIENADKSDNKEAIEKVRNIKKQYERLIERIFGYDIRFGIMKKNGALASGGNLCLLINIDMLDSFLNKPLYYQIEVITHELTHNVEEFIQSYGIDFEEVVNGKSIKDILGIERENLELKRNNFGTHQKDQDHDSSFEKIQRQILKIMTREGL